MGKGTWIPYDVDYSVKNVSKTFGLAKKKILFKLGFANTKEALGNSQGSNCRGSEHEIVLVWTLTNGKRQVTLDGKVVHFSETGENGWLNDQVFQYQFKLNVKGHGIFRCLLFTQQANKNVPGQERPFDLRVDGISFFNFSHIYQLGTAAMIVRENGPTQSYSSGRTEQPISSDEQKALAQAKLESMKDFRYNKDNKNQEPPSNSNTATQDFISFSHNQQSVGNINSNYDNYANNSPHQPPSSYQVGYANTQRQPASHSTALTSYQSPGGPQQTQSTTFVDSAGRLTFGTPPPSMPPQQYTSGGHTGAGMSYHQHQTSIPTSTPTSYPSTQQSYPAPQQSYPASQQSYPGPQQSYRGPQQSYPSPQQSYPVPKHPVPQQSYQQNPSFDPNYGSAPSFARPSSY